MNPCKWCPHKRSQHDEDGFCEQEGENGFCDCIGFEEQDEEKESEVEH